MDTFIDNVIGFGISPERLAQIAVFAPLALLLVSISIYVVTLRRRAKMARQEKIARNITAGARKRSSGPSRDEILAKFRPETDATSSVLRVVTQVSETLLRLVNFDKEATRKKLVQAGYRDPRALSRYIVQRGMGMLLAPVLLWIIAPFVGFTGLFQALVALAGILVGGIVIDVRLDKAVAARRSKIHTELPVLLDLLTIYLEAGAGFDIALGRSANALNKTFPTAATEIHHLRRDLELSIDRIGTLREFANRLNTQTAKTFVAIVVQSERRGNAIAPSLRQLSKDARREVMTDIEKKAQKIPTLMQLPMFVFILPAIFASVLGPAVIQIINEVANAGGAF